MHPAELVVQGMTKRAAFPLFAIPLALAALPTVTYALNRLTGHDPRKKMTQPTATQRPLAMPQAVSPLMQRQMYMRALAQTLAQYPIQSPQQFNPAPFVSTGYGLHAARRF